MWFYSNLDGSIYAGEMAVGDREATQAEVDAWFAPKPPTEVTAAQAKLALDDAGLLDNVETIVANHPVRAVRIWYNNANVWERGNVYIQALGVELGLDDSQIDNLFLAASLK